MHPLSARLHTAVGTGPALYHHSYVYTGLYELAHLGRLGLEGVPAAPGSWATRNVRVDLLLPDGSEIVLAFDLGDESTRFAKQALGAADLYFKRSWFEPDIACLPEELRWKVVPWGLNYACRSWRSVAPLAWVARREAASVPDLATRRRILANLVRHVRLQPPGAFHLPATEPKEERVVFQTRVWDEASLGADRAEEVNEVRAGMVRALRREFGGRFTGGLLPDPLARRRYPDLIAEQRGRQSEYLRLLRRSLVGVYTRGLHHSTAWKLPEYLAATMCVVAEPIRNALQAPLVTDRHILCYDSVDGCLDACVRAFEDRQLRGRLRANAEAYYREHIEPARHMERCLRAAAAWAGTRRLDTQCHNT